jgi:hypothetical protein
LVLNFDLIIEFLKIIRVIIVFTLFYFLIMRSFNNARNFVVEATLFYFLRVRLFIGLILAFSYIVLKVLVYENCFIILI